MQADRQWMTSVAAIWHSMTVSSYDMHVKPSKTGATATIISVQC